VLSFATAAGHRRLTTLLSQAIARGTLPPALLFTGPGGVGKFRIARTVAAAFNCLSPVADANGFAIDACGTCRACSRIDRNVHVDVLVLEPDERASIKIDVVREVLSRTAFRPFEGKRRVVIIREADTLELAAQNALLKSLEEPPSATVFILTTAVPGVLVPTVRSRCMRLRFGRLTLGDIERVLIRDHEVPPQEARVAATLADGSVGQALALRAADPAVLRETALLLLRQTGRRGSASARLQAAAVLVAPAKKERSRDEIALVLRLVSSMLRDIELLNAEGDSSAMAHPALADELKALKRSFAGARARDAFSAVDRALMALERNAGVKVVGEWLAMQI
jgi:DNA polymerase III subunit delta'